jgi:hypothetical protein
MESNSKAAMEPPFGLNPLIQIWRTIDASWVFMHFFLEYFKLAKMTIIHLKGNVKDERCAFHLLHFLRASCELL